MTAAQNLDLWFDIAKALECAFLLVFLAGILTGWILCVILGRSAARKRLLARKAADQSRWEQGHGFDNLTDFHARECRERK